MSPTLRVRLGSWMFHQWWFLWFFREAIAEITARGIEIFAKSIEDRMTARGNVNAALHVVKQEDVSERKRIVKFTKTYDVESRPPRGAA